MSAKKAFAIPAEIAAIVERLHTQDNRITADPLFAVQQKRIIGGVGDDYTDAFAWIGEEGIEAGQEESAALDALHDAGEPIPDGWLRVGYVEKWEFVTGCLTEQGCKDYIARNGHNLKEPRIYAYGSYRNAEWKALREWLMSLAAAPAQAVDADSERLSAELAAMTARKDAAYEERNRVVAALARVFPSGIARTAIEGWSEDWHGCVYIDLPTGQASWHFHDSQAHLFDGLPAYTKPWDGHDTPEKYRRVAALSASPAAQEPPAAPANISAMVDRFLGWKLPKSFSPDAGVKFTPSNGMTREDAYEKGWWPTGTNLLNADESRAMLEYVLAASPAAAPPEPTDTERDALDLLETLFDAYEDGPACYEDPEEQAGYVGNAVKLDHDTFHRIADLLDKRRPRAALSASMKEYGK